MKTLETKHPRFFQSFEVREAEKDSRVLTFTITTNRVALDNGVLIPSGADLARYLENPVVFSDHNQSCLSKIGVTKAMRMTETGWESDVEFAPKETSEHADQIFRFLKWSGFGAVSIGFIVTEMDRDPTPDERALYQLPKYGWIGRKWQLLETSVVGIGADPGALMHSVPTGPEGRALRDASWRSMCRKYALEASTVTAPVETVVVEERGDTSTTATTFADPIVVTVTEPVEHAATPPTVETQSEDSDTSMMLAMLIDQVATVNDKLDILLEQKESASVDPVEETRSADAAPASDFWEQLERAATKVGTRS